MINSLSRTSLLFCTLFLLAIGNGVAQVEREVIQVKDLPPEGFVLDKGWKFKVGDSPEYANAEYDDRGWESINPTLDIHDSLPQIPEGTVCWLRIHLSIDSTIGQLVMMIEQSVASEIYLNGKLIHRLGVLDLDANKTKAFNPKEIPIAFPFDSNIEQLLAIRFSKQPGIGYVTHWAQSNLGVKIVLNTVDGADSYYKVRWAKLHKNNYFLVGIFLIIGVLYLASYLFNRVQRVNLHFSIYAFFQATVWIASLINHETHTVAVFPVIANFRLVLEVISQLLMLLAVYELLKNKKDWIFYSLLVFGIVCTFCGIFIYDWGWLIYGRVFRNALNLTMVGIAFNAMRANKKGASIILIGAIIFTLLFLAFTWRFSSLRMAGDIVSNHDVFTLAQLAMPLAVAIYLGYDFALTNRTLQQKLIEVSTLSDEKQQILTNQNETLERQVSERTAALMKSMDELKSTQTQLIQSEKMASLGELTAGIAHEIQNPLNFVNNFSEVNAELIDDLKKSLKSGDNQSAEEIADTLKDNQEKINNHGKRADGIVKSMLQHSRTSSGQKELTDINTLCDEYLRLAYHGFRAKDKSFNANTNTIFDSTIPKLNVIPQDIGRVILNLINNAFYSVGQRSKENTNGYEPAISLSTKRLNARPDDPVGRDKVEIRVLDNGRGIPEEIKDKIFQPFFTTKPTGQGTGLGLSLAYDIITKGHGGELKVESKEGKSCELIIQLPISKNP